MADRTPTRPKADGPSPRDPKELDAFCTFSGLKHQLHRGKRPSQDHPDCETVPLRTFFGRASQQAWDVVSFVRRHDPRISDDAADALTFAVHEVCQNIEDHAESAEFGGVLCARYFSGSREVRVAIVDRGFTIAAPLQKLHPAYSETDCLSRVCRGELARGFHRHNQGLGVSTLVQMATHRRGSMCILTGAAAADYRADWVEPKVEPLDWRFPGTGVFFTLRVDDVEDAD